jgi:hypothetical protein
MKTFITTLKHNSLAAKDEQQRQLAKSNIIQLDIARKEREAQTALAKEIVGEVKIRAMAASKQGKDGVDVMTLHEPDDFSRTYEQSNSAIFPNNLRGQALYTYEALIAEGFEVNLRFEHDGIGQNSWFVMEARW